MTEKSKTLPYGIGNYSAKWKLIVVTLLVLVGIGIYGYSQQLIHGEYVTGLRNIGVMNGATWGLYVVVYIYLMGLSFAGLSVAALIRVFNISGLKPLARVAEVLALSSVLVGGLTVIVDVGQPLRSLVNLAKYARPQSPFFGTFTIVIAAEIFASLVFLYLGGRSDAAKLANQPSKLSGFYKWWSAGYSDTEAEKERRKITSFWLSIALIPLLLMAFSTVGLIFGLQAGRPGWFGTSRAPGFVVLAALSGVGMLALIAAGLRKIEGIKDKLSDDIFKILANVMMILNVIYVYLFAVEWISSTYSSQNAESDISQALISGEYSVLFWMVVALLILPLILMVTQFVQRKFSMPFVLLSAVMVNFAAIGRRYLIVVPSQTHGTLLPYGIGSYSPTWVEFTTVIGLFSLVALLITMFIKFFPIFEIESVEGGA